MSSKQVLFSFLMCVLTITGCDTKKQVIVGNEKPKVQCNFHIFRFFPAQIGVWRRTDTSNMINIICHIAIIIKEINDKLRTYSTADITSESGCQPKSQSVQYWFDRLHKVLFADVPGSTCGPVRIELLVATEVGAAVFSERSIQYILCFIIIIGGSIEGSELLLIPSFTGRSIQSSQIFFQLVIVNSFGSRR